MQTQIQTLVGSVFIRALKARTPAPVRTVRRRTLSQTRGCLDQSDCRGRMPLAIPDR